MILVRHGQSEFNVVYSVTRQDPGIPDPRLTDEGRRQAEAAAVSLAGRDVAELVASPYTRALETAEIIAGKLGLPIRIEPLVREHCRFHCDIGSARSLLADRWPALDFAHLPEKWWPDLDETDEQLLGRCRDFRAAMARHPDWRRGRRRQPLGLHPRPDRPSDRQWRADRVRPPWRVRQRAPWQSRRRQSGRLNRYDVAAGWTAPPPVVRDVITRHAPGRSSRGRRDCGQGGAVLTGAVPATSREFPEWPPTAATTNFA